MTNQTLGKALNAGQSSHSSENHQLLLDQRAVAQKREGTEHINKCYLFGLLFVVTMGMLQFGMGIGSWNTAVEAYAANQDWDDDEKTTKNTVV